MRAISGRSIAALLTTAVAFAVSAPCHAVTIAYVGTEPGTTPNFVTQNWSNSAVPKSYATGTSNTYGKNGYWQIRPIPYPPSSTIYTPAASGNDLGTSGTSFPTLWSGSLPAFMSSITGGAGDFVNFNSYAIYRGPDGSALYTQGGLSVPVNQGPFNTPSGANTGYFGLSADMVLTFSGTVRVGIAVDSVNDGTYAPNYVGIYSNSTGTVFSSVLTRDGTPDMAVFDIVNPAGETFTVSQWQLAGTQSASAFSLVTVDVIPVPEPSTVALVAMGGVTVATYLRRRRRKSGELS